MKECLCCGLQADYDAFTCLVCGESSWRKSIVSPESKPYKSEDENESLYDKNSEDLKPKRSKRGSL